MNFETFSKFDPEHQDMIRKLEAAYYEMEKTLHFIGRGHNQIEALNRLKEAYMWGLEEVKVSQARYGYRAEPVEVK